MKRLPSQETKLRDRFLKHEQHQVFRFWKELSDAQRSSLLEQLERIDLIACQRAIVEMESRTSETQQTYGQVRPIEATQPLDPGIFHWRSVGEELLFEGRVAAFTVAGGQGTRLGHRGPKGSLPSTPLSRKTLFEHFSQSMLFCAKRYGKCPWWFIMTSPENHLATEQFFRQNEHFGYPREKILLFKQGMMPVFDFCGKISMEQKHRVAMSPNGHGGCFEALVRSGATAIMEEEGIDYLSYFQVDNPMVYCLDPAFLGIHHETGSEMSSKAVTKTKPEEKVGTFVLREGMLGVVEYSDLPSEWANLRNEKGVLTLGLGNIAIHVLSLEFIKRISGSTEDGMNLRLPFHGARKKAAILNESGKRILPTQPNALKAETFVFDALPSARNPVVMKIDRKEEFAPIKNPSGEDSLASSQDLQIQRHKRWLQHAKISKLPDKVEISPSFAPTLPHFLERLQQIRLPDSLIDEQTLLLDEQSFSQPTKNKA